MMLQPKQGKLAGLDNIILLQEPIAAAMAYGMKPNAKINTDGL